MNNIIKISVKGLKKYKLCKTGDEYFAGDLLEIWPPNKENEFIGDYAELEASYLTKVNKFRIIKEVKVYRK